MCEKGKGSSPSGGQGGRGLSAPPDSPRLGFSPIFHYMLRLCKLGSLGSWKALVT